MSGNTTNTVDLAAAYKTESQGGKFMRKAKEAPFVPLGIAGMIVAVGWGIKNFRNRGDMAPSLYLIQMRVRAQAMVVGALTIGVGYTLLKDYFKPAEENKNK